MDSNFFCYAATVLSPHRNVPVFTQRMYKPGYRKAVYVINRIYTPFSKGVFLQLKDFDQSQELQTIARKVYNFSCSPHRISVFFKLKPDLVIWKMVGK